MKEPYDHIRKTTPLDISLWELCQNPNHFRTRNHQNNNRPPAGILKYSPSKKNGFFGGTNCFRMRIRQNSSSSVIILMISCSKAIGFWQSSYSEMSRCPIYSLHDLFLRQYFSLCVSSYVTDGLSTGPSLGEWNLSHMLWTRRRVKKRSWTGLLNFKRKPPTKGSKLNSTWKRPCLLQHTCHTGHLKTTWPTPRSSTLQQMKGSSHMCRTYLKRKRKVLSLVCVNIHLRRLVLS